MSILDRQNTISSAFKNIHKDIEHKLKIPMMKKARSLNVAISAAISVSEAMRQIKLLK